MDGQILRDGIFALNTRRFGTVAEVMVGRLIHCGKGRSLFHDLYDDAAERRIEVKFSRVQKKADETITEDNILESIEQATAEERHIAFTEWRSSEFDCNIQQIKKAEFDVLYYGLFFADRVLIFRIKSEEIGQRISYSDKQHKGNIGEGQFHINQHTLQVHLDNYLYRELSYQELYNLLC